MAKKIILACTLCFGCATEKAQTRSDPQTAQTQVSEADKSGTLPAEQAEAIEMLFHRKVATLQRCWNDEYEKTHNRKLEGDVTVGLTVTTTGKPADVKILESTFNAAEFEACVVKEVQGWEFPEVSVSSPYVRKVHIGAQF